MCGKSLMVMMMMMILWPWTRIIFTQKFYNNFLIFGEKTKHPSLSIYTIDLSVISNKLFVFFSLEMIMSTWIRIEWHNFEDGHLTNFSFPFSLPFSFPCPFRSKVVLWTVFTQFQLVGRICHLLDYIKKT